MSLIGSEDGALLGGRCTWKGVSLLPAQPTGAGTPFLSLKPNPGPSISSNSNLGPHLTLSP